MRGASAASPQPWDGAAVAAGACSTATLTRALSKVTSPRRSVPAYVRGRGSSDAMVYRGKPWFEMAEALDGGAASSADGDTPSDAAVSYAKTFRDGGVPTPSYVQPLSGVRGAPSHGPPWLPVPASRASLAKSASLSTLGGAGWVPPPQATRRIPPVHFDPSARKTSAEQHEEQAETKSSAATATADGAAPPSPLSLAAAIPVATTPRPARSPRSPRTRSSTASTTAMDTEPRGAATVSWNLRASIVAPKGSAAQRNSQETVMRLAQKSLSDKLQRCRYLIHWAFGAFEEIEREVEREAALAVAAAKRAAALSSQKGGGGFAAGLRGIVSNSFQRGRGEREEIKTRHRIHVMHLVGVLEATGAFESVELEHIKRRVTANCHRILAEHPERAAAPQSVDEHELGDAFGILDTRVDYSLEAATQRPGHSVGVCLYATVEEAETELLDAMAVGSELPEGGGEGGADAPPVEAFRVSLRYKGMAARTCFGASEVTLRRVAMELFNSKIDAPAWASVALRTHIIAVQHKAASQVCNAARMFRSRKEMHRLLRVRVAMSRFRHAGAELMRMCFEGWLVASQQQMLARHAGCRKLREWRNVVAAVKKKRDLFRTCFWPMHVWQRETRIAIVGGAKAKLLVQVWKTMIQLSLFRAWKEYTRVRMIINREVRRMELRRAAMQIEVWRAKVTRRKSIKLMVGTQLTISMEERALPLLALRYWMWGRRVARTMGYGERMRDTVRKWLENRVEYQSMLVAAKLRDAAHAQESLAPPDPLAGIMLLQTPLQLGSRLAAGNTAKRFLGVFSQHCMPMRLHFREIVWQEMRVNYARLWRVGKKVFKLWAEVANYSRMTDMALGATLGGRRFVLSGTFARWGANVRRARRFAKWRDHFPTVRARRDESRRVREKKFIERWTTLDAERITTLAACEKRLAKLRKRAGIDEKTSTARVVHVKRERERFSMMEEDSEVFFAQRTRTHTRISSVVAAAGSKVRKQRGKILLDVCYKIHMEHRKRITLQMVRECLRGLRIQLLEAKGKRLLNRAKIRNWLRIAARFRRLYRGMPVYRRLRVMWGCFNNWLRYIGRRVMLMPPGLLIESERRRDLLLRFSTVLEESTARSSYLAPLEETYQLIGNAGEVLALNAGMLMGHVTSLSVDLPRIGANIHCCLTRWMEYTQISLIWYKTLPDLVACWYSARVMKRVFEALRSGLKVRYALKSRGRTSFLEASTKQAIDHWLMMLHSRHDATFVTRVRRWRHFARGKLKRLSREESLKRLLVRHRREVLERLKIEQSYLFEHYRDRKKVEVNEWDVLLGTHGEHDDLAKGSFQGPVPDLAAAEENTSRSVGGAVCVGDGWSLSEINVFCDRDGVCGIGVRVRLTDPLVLHGHKGE